MEELVVSIRVERRWPLQLALAVAALWLAAIALGLAANPQPLATMMAVVLPPIGLALVVYALLAHSSRPLPLGDVEARLVEAQGHVVMLEAALGRVDAAVGGALAQFRDLAASVAADMPGVIADTDALETTAQRVLASGEASGKVTAAMLAALPEIARTVGSVGDTLRDVGGESATQLRAVETMLAAVRARNHEATTEADTAIAEMAALLARIDEASTRNTAALSKRAYAIDAAIDGVLERSAAVVGQINDQVDTQMRSFAAGIEATARQMQMFGDDGARLFNQRLDALLKTSSQLKSEIDAHDAGAARLHEAVNDRIEDMQQRYARLNEAGIGAVDDGTTRIAAFQDRIAGLQGQIETSQAALIGMDGDANALGQTVAGMQAVVVERLADTRESMAALESEAQHMLDAVVGLGKSVRDSGAAVATAAAGFAAERVAIVGLAAQLEAHFDTARDTLAEIRTDSSAATIEAAATLDAELVRIGTVAAETATAMRASLAGVVDDAMGALQRAAATGTDAAFGEPVRAQLAAVEGATARAAEAGQEMSRRLAGQMLALVETVAAAEARIGDVETRFDVRERNSLAAQSMRIMAQLDTALVDVARLLVLPVGEDEWARYLRGDRGAFSRAVVPLLDREASRRIARLHTHDGEFRAIAATYMQGFEKLVSRLLDDRDGEALAATLLSSDIGKIYVVIAEAADRLPPTRGQ